ncbi:hypothetical protein ACLKA7_010873 [Drosophila subpalustris]
MANKERGSGSQPNWPRAFWQQQCPGQNEDSMLGLLACCHWSSTAVTLSSPKIPFCEVDNAHLDRHRACKAPLGFTIR